jgi:hypothetical protein
MGVPPGHLAVSHLISQRVHSTATLKVASIRVGKFGPITFGDVNVAVGLTPTGRANIGALQRIVHSSTPCVRRNDFAVATRIFEL